MLAQDSKYARGRSNLPTLKGINTRESTLPRTRNALDDTKTLSALIRAEKACAQKMCEQKIPLRAGHFLVAHVSEVSRDESAGRVPAGEPSVSTFSAVVLLALGHVEDLAENAGEKWHTKESSTSGNEFGRAKRSLPQRKVSPGARDDKRAPT